MTHPAVPFPSMSPPAEPDPLAPLLRAAADGDQDSFGRLYDATNRRVFGMVLRVVRDRDAAEDVTLEAYAQAWRQAGLFDTSRGSVLTWLLTIARSRAIDRVRIMRRQHSREQWLESTSEPVDPSVSQDHQVVQQSLLLSVRSALERLPSEQKQALEAAYFDGLSHSEVATALNLPLGTVKTRIRAGMSMLRQALTGAENETHA